MQIFSVNGAKLFELLKFLFLFCLHLCPRSTRAPRATLSNAPFDLKISGKLENITTQVHANFQRQRRKTFGVVNFLLISCLHVYHGRTHALGAALSHAALDLKFIYNESRDFK